MKKFVKSFFIAAAALILFAGCSNIEENDATVYGEEVGGKSVLTIGIEGYTSTSARTARTINPTPYAAGKKDFTKITLEGISETQAKLTSTIDDEEVEYIDLTAQFADGDTASVSLDASIWYITIKAYDGTNLVLQGRRRVDMTSGTSAVNFSLSADGVTTKGGVNITVAFASTVNVEGITAKGTLFNIDTNEYVDQDAALTGFNYTNNNLDPGRYAYTIKFYKGTKKMGVWGDTVVVAPGRTTTPTPNPFVLPDILAKAPEAPSNFHAYIVDGSEKGDYYNVLFTWTRAALKNEENFEITLKTYETATTTDADAVVYKIYGIEDKASDKKEVFFESNDRVAGSLNACEESCIIRLPTGTLFDASIKAQNFVGDSSSVTRTSDTTAATGDDIPANTPYGSTKINRVRITYNLNGGILTRTIGGEDVVTTGSLTVYDTYTNAAKPLMTIDDIKSLKKDALTLWKEEWRDGTTAAAEKVETYTWNNLTVYANYDFTDTDITFTVVDVWGDITASASAQSGGTWDADANTLTITNNSRITFTAENASASDTATITKIKYNIDGDEFADEQNGTSIAFPGASKLSARKHTVVITATKDDGKAYGAVLYIDVKR